MRKLRKNIGLAIFIFIAGILIGTLIGDLLGILLPEGVVKRVMLYSIKIGFQPFTLNLHIITITFGFMFKINLFGVLGVLILGYVLKWLY